MGHYHTPMVKDIGRTKVVYPGCPEPLDFGDKGERGVYFVTVAGLEGERPFNVRSEFVPMALRMVREQELDLTGLDTGEKIRNAILSVGDHDIRRRDMWQLMLTGRVDPDLPLDLDVLEREMRDNFFHLRLIPKFVPDYDLGPLLDSNNQSLEGKFVQTLKEIEKQAIENGDEMCIRDRQGPIGVVNMGHLNIAVGTVFEKLGIEAKIAGPLSDAIVELGRELAPEFICYPMVTLLGQIRSMIDQGVSRVVMIQGKGKCRLGWYAQIMETILNRAGYKVRIYAIDLSLIHI